MIEIDLFGTRNKHRHTRYAPVDNSRKIGIIVSSVMNWMLSRMTNSFVAPAFHSVFNRVKVSPTEAVRTWINQANTHKLMFAQEAYSFASSSSSSSSSSYSAVLLRVSCMYAMQWWNPTHACNDRERTNGQGLGTARR